MIRWSDVQEANGKLARTLLVGIALGLVIYVGSGLVLPFVPNCEVPAIDACPSSSEIHPSPSILSKEDPP